MPSIFRTLLKQYLATNPQIVERLATAVLHGLIDHIAPTTAAELGGLGGEAPASPLAGLGSASLRPLVREALDYRDAQKTQPVVPVGIVERYQRGDRHIWVNKREFEAYGSYLFETRGFLEYRGPARDQRGLWLAYKDATVRPL